ncbi:hypothetical protein CVV68_16630 [Arthrobacter livingstonensis]|uniref:Uncharacterized protein n=1 Tax=Arthrobacter livingstonensis TaxID=670078 RepID=A0A2V5LH08_9MICC|nr:hypothetical protein [Arthrobacter livingstonensis]PYI65850.1 hypothetical protein CVV68_16630 [Arthrobacter livingstonensis]
MKRAITNRAIMEVGPNTSTTGAVSGKRWRKRTAAAAAGAVLIGAGIFGATAASATGTFPSTTASQSAAPAAQASGSAAPAAQASKAAGKHQAKHPEVRLLRRELRIDIQAKAGFGDRAHMVAYGLIHHQTAFAKLPAQLRTELSSLEAAAAGSRDADAALIKTTALSGGYGAAIQKQAKAVAAKLASAPATAAP